MLLIPARLGHFLLTLNRFTIIRLMARKHDKGAYLRLPTSEHNFYILESYSLDIEVRQSAYSIAVIVLFFPVNLAMNISIAQFLWKHRKKHESHGNIVGGVNQDAEMKLCFITFTMFVTNIVGLVCQMLFFIYGTAKIDMSPLMVRTLSNIGTFAEDLHVFSQPWMLIAMSGAVRSELIKILWCRLHRTSPVVSHNKPSIQSLQVRRSVRTPA
ncbi:srg family chemoreceptor domain-containing protein [Ditylenchus destructor]|uniref:Serpentine receptor class gamma n=1 Tax=Ditylenchus destructor TaxID=166010 RepID=A0AAD4QY19_9BILA|nr:srg family chemoreceptor domain-containing protein [Ditylenchus destructor]